MLILKLEHDIIYCRRQWDFSLPTEFAPPGWLAAYCIANCRPRRGATTPKRTRNPTKTTSKPKAKPRGQARSNPVKVVFPKARPNRVPPPRTPPMKPPRQPLAGRAVPDPRSLRGSLTYYPALLTRASVPAPVECAGKAPAATALSPHPSMKPHGYHRPVAPRPGKTVLRGIYGEAPSARRADGPGGWTASALKSFAGRKS